MVDQSQDFIFDPNALFVEISRQDVGGWNIKEKIEWVDVSQWSQLSQCHGALHCPTCSRALALVNARSYYKDMYCMSEGMGYIVLK
jgi:hypothetical protein